jgi:hypothetical protein
MKLTCKFDRVRDMRGSTFEAPEWWLRLARRELANNGAYQTLSAKLAALIGRKKPWHHATLSRFVTNSPNMNLSQEFATAVSLYFNIPAPLYVPRTLEEARAMQATQELASKERPRRRTRKVHRPDSDAG